MWPDFTKMSPSEIIAFCSDNCTKWAAAFMQITKDRPITEDDMRGWFANAIENGHDAKMRRKRSCLNCGETQKNDGPFCNQTEDGCTQEVSEAYCCGKWYPAN